LKRSLLPKDEPRQRLVVTFSRGEKLKYIAHLDMMRLWHRALRRAGMPLAYSQGFHPQPRVAIASPLAVGVTSEGELMDVFLQRKVSLDFFAKALREQLPEGVEIMDVKDVWPRLPSLQSQLRFVEYKVETGSEKTPEKINEAIRSLLEKESLPWQHYRGEKVHKYDLRALIDDIWVIRAEGPGCILGMRLRNDSRGSGRPDQVLLALGFADPAKSIHRTRLSAGTN